MGGSPPTSCFFMGVLLTKGFFVKHMFVWIPPKKKMYKEIMSSKKSMVRKQKVKLTKVRPFMEDFLRYIFVFCFFKFQVNLYSRYLHSHGNLYTLYIYMYVYMCFFIYIHTPTFG